MPMPTIENFKIDPKANKIVVGIHSDKTLRDSIYDGTGHAWITIHVDGERVATFGNYPSSLRFSSVQMNWEITRPHVVSRYYEIGESQAKKLEQRVKKYTTWTYDYNCTSWAIEVANDICLADLKGNRYAIFDLDSIAVGVNFDIQVELDLGLVVVSTGEVETPFGLGGCIEELEKKDPTSVAKPKFAKLYTFPGSPKKKIYKSYSCTESRARYLPPAPKKELPPMPRRN